MHVERMGAMRNVYKILVLKKLRSKENVKIVLTVTGFEDMDCVHMTQNRLQ